MKYVTLLGLFTGVVLSQVDILLIGDYGWTPDMTDPNLNFNAINSYVGNLTAKGGKIDFIMTTGDNLYVKNETNPTLEEADIMMDLFLKREHLKNLNVWPVMGNHDCYALDKYFEVNLTQRYNTWKFPSLYHEERYDLGHGKQLAFLYVDSCLALCSDLVYGGGPTFQEHEIPKMSREKRVLLEEKQEEMQRLKDVKCGDPVATQMGNDMWKWMNQTLAKWDKDPNIVWKATVQHHPIFAKWYSDYLNITTNYLPMLLDHKIDFYLNGHEHTMEYAYYPYNEVPNSLNSHHLQDYQCSKDLELFFGASTRYSEFTKGDALHQWTIGSTGYDIYDVCPSRPSMGWFRYLNNKVHGFGHLRATENEFTIRMFGINQETQETQEVYKVTIYNN